MATKRSNTPEKSIDSGELVDLAKDALSHRAQAAEHTTREKAIAEDIGRQSEDLRRQEVEQGSYLGLLRITGENQAPVRVEFRFENGALSIDQESNLDALYKGSRPVLFKREKAVTSINDPRALIQQLLDAGVNPFDYLELKVRSGMDHALVDSPHVSTAEALLPTEGFLSTIEGIKNVLSEEAKTFTKNYLEGALKPRVVLGTKGKA